MRPHKGGTGRDVVPASIPARSAQKGRQDTPIALAAWNNAVGERLWLGIVQIGPWALHPLVAMFAVSGSLMISRTLHIPKL